MPKFDIQVDVEVTIRYQVEAAHQEEAEQVAERLETFWLEHAGIPGDLVRASHQGTSVTVASTTISHVLLGG